MSYRTMLKHRKFFKALNYELKFVRTGCITVSVKVVIEEPPILIVDALGVSLLPYSNWWADYLQKGDLPGD